jgi:pimeloyl-ACP methyl ester carboxylesterase
MLWWDEVFCLQLADQKRFVIRFDNRDTGQSSMSPIGHPSYTIEDMADDCMRVLDFWHVEKAHLVGMSLGGMIIQIAALKYRPRVLSLICLASGIWGSCEVPITEISGEMTTFLEKNKSVDWSNRTAAVDFMVRGGAILSGKGRVFNETRHRELAHQVFDYSSDLHSLWNHSLVRGGESFWNRMGEISVPTLVVHGTEDRIMPYAYASALAETIPGARRMTFEGAGHELHQSDWPAFIQVITEITGTNELRDV